MGRPRKKIKKVSTNLSFSSPEFVEAAKAYAFDAGENSLSELAERLPREEIERNNANKPPNFTKQIPAVGPADRISRSA